MCILQVSNLMTPPSQTVTCLSNMTVSELAVILLRERAAAAVVLRDQRPVGIVTRHQLVLKCILEDALHGPVHQMMVPHVPIDMDYSRNQAASVMHRKRVHHLVVCCRDGRCLGLISSLDIARHDAATLRSNLVSMGRGSPVPEEMSEGNSLPKQPSFSDCGMVQIGSRVSVTLEASFFTAT